MSLSMKQWQEAVIQDPTKKPMPILSFPGIQLTGASVRDVVQDAKAQAACLKAIADRYQTLATVSNMDLSVEAEAFGAQALFSEDEVPNITGRLIETQADVDSLAIPPVGAGRTGATVEAIRLAVQQITDRPVFAGVIGPFSLAGRLMDLTEIMYAAMDDPDLVQALLDKVSTFLIDYIQAFRRVGAKGIVMAEPAAGLLSPDWNRLFSAPYVTRIIQAVQSDDFLVVYHNCGQVAPLLPDLLATGARAFHFGNAADLPALIKAIPHDLLVMGNIDPATQIAQGTPASIRQVTEQLVQAMREHPNFVLSSGCDIPPHAPLANIDAFFEAAQAQP